MVAHIIQNIVKFRFFKLLRVAKTSAPDGAVNRMLVLRAIRI